MRFRQEIQAMSWEIGLIPVVVGMLVRDGKVLVAERPLDKPYSGYWEFPGGKIEADESPADALKRELHEELGIDVVSSESLLEHQHVYPDKTVYLHILLVTQFKGEPHSNENQQLRWVTLTEIQTLRILEGNWPIIEKLNSLFSIK
jgi:8-oxo-dGTP diphosphatase